MFCPACRDEFRPGFTRCANCNVDLVESLPDAEGGHAAAGRADAPPVVPRGPMADYCGFVSLDDARGARDRLKHEGVYSEIVIRESSASFAAPGTAAQEEYWLRIQRDAMQQAFALLGWDEATQDSPEDALACGECGAEVASEESFCPRCGARFEEGG